MTKRYDPGLEVTGDHWMKLHRNENLFVENLFISELSRNAIDKINLCRYPDSNSNNLRKKIGDLYDIDADQIYIGNGSDEILADLFYYLRSRFTEAVTPFFTYRVYSFLLEKYGYKQLALDCASQEHLCIIDSPNSLTGETLAVFDIPSSFLIWDNVYGEFARDELHRKQISRSAVILRSFSKFYGLANLRVGYAITGADIVYELMKRKDIYNVNGFAQEMALRVLENKPYFDSLIPKIEQSRIFLSIELKKLGFIISNSKTNFVWISHPSVSAETIQKGLEKAYILVRRFSDPAFINYIRITVPPMDKIEQVIEVIKRYI